MNLKTTLLFSLFLLLSVVTFAQNRNRHPEFFTRQTNSNLALPAPVQTLVQAQTARLQNTTSQPGTEHRFGWINNAWQHLGHLTYTYDAARNITQTLITNTGETQPFMRTLDEFDAQNRPLFSTDQLWQNGQWVNDFRITYTYDAAGNILLREEQIADGAGWITDYAERYTYQLNSAGHKTEEHIEKFEDGTWENWRKAEYIQGPNGAYTESTFWSWENGAWTHVNRQTDIVWYDFATDRREKYIMHFWNGTAWEATERYTLTYGQYESIEQIMELRMPNGQWIPMSRIQIAIDEHGNDLNIFYEINQGNGWAFMLELNNILTYDAAGNLIERIEQSRQEGMPALVNELKFVFSDFQQINATEEDLEITLSTWPNPATDRLRISTNQSGNAIKSVQLFDMTGRSAYAKKMDSEDAAFSIPVQHLPSGLYLLRAETNQGFVEQKIMKQ